ncbi:ABC transporter permease [Conexibacter sp. JD483]|uniref:ABC transporter permease n=1 Tax=unclassified Conexibacter TaxID=2627773 RepID=UPI002720BF4B|nr:MULTISPECIES: ABC transporter permease [unclassified Conexibacter]MDO8187097.1 ABC transporter permease [Conexibacter sp. CPCC 205706]MDO8200955.1 ABC transporter permease [Conexibacter sp. CPCC 205762]MDR9371892.1 ABC transporter permease [Conexibacter sp. JD483]
MTALRLILRRAAIVVPLLLAVTVIVFLIVQLLPGDPATAVLGEFASKEQRAEFAAANGLNDPLPTRYLRFLGDLLHGDLGVSMTSGQDVGALLQKAVPVTIQLTLLAMLLAVVYALVFGILSAVHRGTWFDKLGRALSIGGLAAPSFWVGLVLVQIFALELGLLPSGGYLPMSAGLGSWFEAMILPASALALSTGSTLVRVVRASVVQELERDYVRTARGLGLPPYVVIGRNVLRNALITPMTVLGLRIGYMLSGAVVIESIYSLPGVGRLLLSAVDSGDLAIIQGVVLFGTLAFIVVNLVVDVLSILLNPRLRTA